MHRLRVLLPNWDKLVDQVINHHGYYASHWLDTLSVSITACILATVLAAVLALLGLRYSSFYKLVSPMAAVSQSFPLQALGPVIIIVLGTGFSTKALIALTITFFPIQSAIATAFLDTPAQYLMHSRVCRADFLTTFFHVQLPFALPRTISAIKVGFTLSVIGAVVAEFISPQGGIGEILLIAQSSFNIEAIYICLFILIVQGLSIYLVLSWLERRVASTRSITRT